MHQLPDYKPSFPHWSQTDLRDHVPTLDDEGIELLQVRALPCARRDHTPHSRSVRSSSSCSLTTPRSAFLVRLAPAFGVFHCTSDGLPPLPSQARPHPPVLCRLHSELVCPPDLAPSVPRYVASHARTSSPPLLAHAHVHSRDLATRRPPARCLPSLRLASPHCHPRPRPAHASVTTTH